MNNAPVLVAFRCPYGCAGVLVEVEAGARVRVWCRKCKAYREGTA